MSTMLRGAVVGAVIAGSAAANAASSLTYIGQQVMPTGTTFAGTNVGGLSGIDFDPSTGRYFAISDDRANSALGGGITDNRARFYDLSLDLGAFTRSNAPGFAGVTIHSVTIIKKPDGSDSAAGQLDPESIRFDGTSLYWASEGSRTATSLQTPFIRKMTVTGAHLSELQTPSRFNPMGAGATDPGVRNNLAFESLTLSIDATKVYTATEAALVQDGAAPNLASGSASRVIELDKSTGATVAELVYPVSPIPLAPMPAGAFADNGLVEMLAIGERQFITVERSFATGVGNTIKLFYADARGASDVSGLATLVGASYTPIVKTLLLDLATLRNDDGSVPRLDNIEGIAFGPTFDGKPTIILVSDNNFSTGQFTQFVALGQVGPIPEPGTYALMATGLALVCTVALRRRRARD